MPVTIKVSPHGSSSWNSSRFTHVQSAQRLLQATTSDEGAVESSSSKPLSIVQTSFRDDVKATPSATTPASPTTDTPSSSTSSLAAPSSNGTTSRRSSTAAASPPLFASKNGLVHGCIEAYNNHHSLVLRPDDVWLAILTQLSVYVNAHAEDLRDRFVNHSGQQRLHIEVELKDADHGALAVEMSRLLQLAIREPGWRDWILPRFTTTERTDETVAAVVMMGTFQKYFTYSWGTRCGLPSVTLLGEPRDWMLLRDRVVGGGGVGVGTDQQQRVLQSLGKECAAWARTLAPVLDGFVESFRDPEGKATRRFWQGICDELVPNGSGAVTYGGWITAFCFWDEKGTCLHDRSASGSSGPGARASGPVRLTRSQIPSGFVKCPVVLINQGLEIPTEMVAGSVGIRVRRSAARTDADDREERKTSAAAAAGRRGSAGSAAEGRFFGLDEVQPESGWFMYLV